MSEENREQQHCENRNTRFNVDIQFNRFAEDWRHVNTIIWQLPSIAISIMGGIVAVAYNLLEGWPRIMLLSTGSLFMIVLTIVVARQIAFANTRFRFLQYLEYKHNAKIFPTGLHDDLDKIDSELKDMPPDKLTFPPNGGDRFYKLLSREFEEVADILNSYSSNSTSWRRRNRIVYVCHTLRSVSELYGVFFTTFHKGCELAIPI